MHIKSAMELMEILILPVISRLRHFSPGYWNKNCFEKLSIRCTTPYFSRAVDYNFKLEAEGLPPNLHNLERKVSSKLLSRILP